MFQEGPNRHLELMIWFDTLRVSTPDLREIPIDEFIAGGRRWWDGLHRGDLRTQDRGIYPLNRTGD